MWWHGPPWMHPAGLIFPDLVDKVEKKGRTKAELDEAITWLTGYTRKKLAAIVKGPVDFEAFFADAPQLNPNADKITGVVCGVRVEEVEHPLMQKIRWVDKLVDEIAGGKKMVKVLRS